MLHRSASACRIISCLLAAAISFSPAASFAADQVTTLHPGDKVAISVYNHPELTSTPVVDAAGNVTMSLIGSVPATSRTAEQLAQEIQMKLKRYVVSPAVDVQLSESTGSVFIVGPMSGVLTYSPGETLLSALAQAQSMQNVAPSMPGTVGGTVSTSSATLDLRTLRESSIDLRHVVIRRDGHDMAPINVEELLSSGLSGPYLMPSDTIALHDRPVRVGVQGIVHHPVDAHLYPDEPLVDALRQAGGVDDTAAGYHFTLVRDGQSYAVSTLSPQLSAPAQAGDMLVVPQAPRVVIAGQVQKPGPVAVQGDPTLLSALYLAGGPQTNGDISHVSVFHDGKQVRYDLTKMHDGRLMQNPVLADGDSVFVPTAHRLNFATLFQGIYTATIVHGM
jgi:polysaccharide export outer membrane protein